MRVRRTALYLVAVTAALAAWVTFAVAMTLALPDGRAVAVIGVPDHVARLVADAGGSLLSSSRAMVIARSDDPGFVRRLYAAGALLVLDAEDSGGCTGLTVARRLRQS